MKSEKPERKVRTAVLIMFIRLMPIWLILAVLIAGALLFLPLFGKPIIQLYSTENQSGSDIILEEIQDVYRFHTVEYVYKIVFPFDYDTPGVSGWQILKKINSHLNAANTSFLTPPEQTWLQAVEISRRNRLKIYDPDNQFLVVTVVVRAGFDLLGSGLENPAGMTKLERDRFIALSTETVGGKPVRKAVVTLPPVIISDTEIEDPIRGQYPFPDIGLDPKGWKEIAAFIDEKTQARAIDEGILVKARENAQIFINELLASAGIDEVSFK